MEPTKELGNNQSLNVEEHFGNIELENRMTDLEQRIIYLEKKKSNNFWVIVLGLIVVVVGLCLFRV